MDWIGALIHSTGSIGLTRCFRTTLAEWGDSAA
jgi:hypothetical protein